MGVALGLGAALSWGLADYFAAVASRSAGTLRVVLGFHLMALVPLTVLVLATSALNGVTATQVGLLALTGAVGWVSYLAFYGALAIGPISVLSPIVSGYAAVTVLLAVAFAGNRLSAAQAISVAITISGAMLASADIRTIARVKLQRRAALGFVLALCAMGLLGTFVFGVSYYRGQIGWLAPIFLARGFAAAFLLGHVLSTRGSDRAAASADPTARRGEAAQAKEARRADRAAGVAGHGRLRVLQPRRGACPNGDRRRGLRAVRGRADRDGRLTVRGTADPAPVVGRGARGGRRDRAGSCQLRSHPIGNARSHPVRCTNMSKPLIGVSASLHDFGDYGGIGVHRPLLLSGGMPVTLPQLPDAIAPALDAIGALVLAPGRDIEPRRYGQEPHPLLAATEPQRDAFELELVAQALDRGMPMLGMCRGIQVLNVALGGTLAQDVSLLADAHPSDPGWAKWKLVEASSVAGSPPPPHPRHEIEIAPGSLLEGALDATSVEVNSFHHQAIDRLGEGLAVVALSADGVAEAVEIPGRPVLAVQWELQEEWRVDSRFLRVFEWFVEAARGAAATA